MVQVEPTGSLMKRIGCWVFRAPRRWWSMISVMVTSSAPLTAWVISLWSTRTSLVLTGFRISPRESTPTRRLLSSSTMKVETLWVAILRRISAMRASGCTEVNWVSITRSMVEAVRTTQAVVAES